MTGRALKLNSLKFLIIHPKHSTHSLCMPASVRFGCTSRGSNLLLSRVPMATTASHFQMLSRTKQVGTLHCFSYA